LELQTDTRESKGKEQTINKKRVKTSVMVAAQEKYKKETQLAGSLSGCCKETGLWGNRKGGREL